MKFSVFLEPTGCCCNYKPLNVIFPCTLIFPKYIIMCCNFGTNSVSSSPRLLCAWYMIGKTHSSNMPFLKLIFPYFLTSPSEIDQQTLLVRGFAHCGFAYLRKNSCGNPHASRHKILHWFSVSLSSIGEIIICRACPLVSLSSYVHVILCRTEYWKSS